MRGIFSVPFSEVCERVDEFLAEQVGKLLELSFDENGVTRVFLLAVFFRPLSRCDPCSIRPALLHCFCIGGPASIAALEQEAREGAREASLEHVDLAEERVGLYGDAT